jgi:hypothetical protein
VAEYYASALECVYVYEEGLFPEYARRHNFPRDMKEWAERLKKFNEENP